MDYLFLETISIGTELKIMMEFPNSHLLWKDS